MLVLPKQDLHLILPAGADPSICFSCNLMGWTLSLQLAAAGAPSHLPTCPLLVPGFILGAITVTTTPFSEIVELWLLSSLLDRGHEMGPSPRYTDHQHLPPRWGARARNPKAISGLASHTQYLSYCLLFQDEFGTIFKTAGKT